MSTRSTAVPPAHDLGKTPSAESNVDRLGPSVNTSHWDQNPEFTSSRDHGTAPELPPLFKWLPSTTRRNKTGSTTLSTKSGSKRGDHFKSMRRSGPTRRAVSPSAAPHEATARQSLALSSNSSWSATGRRCPQSPIRSVPESRTTTPPHLDFLPLICRQHSVSIQKADDLRTSQGFQYKSDEWEDFHWHARNSIEGLNGNAKDDGQESIDSTSRRRVRGFAAAAVFMAILLTTFNLRTITSFIKEERAAEQSGKSPDPQNKIQGRRRDRVSVNSYIGSLPKEPILLQYHLGTLASPLRT